MNGDSSTFTKIPSSLVNNIQSKGEDAGNSGSANQRETSKGVDIIKEELALARKMMGGAVAQRLCMEMDICANASREEPLPNSQIMLDNLLGTDMSVSLGNCLRPKDTGEGLFLNKLETPATNKNTTANVHILSGVMNSVKSELDAFRKKTLKPSLHHAQDDEDDRPSTPSTDQVCSAQLSGYPVWVQSIVLWFVDHDRILTLSVRSFKLCLWLGLFVIFVKLQFGAVFCILSLFALIWLGLRRDGERKEGELSAYSVFNPNCERLPGTLTAEQFEQELRHGSGSVR